MITPFTQREIANLVIMAATADPNQFTEDDAKALFYKCRSLVTITERPDGTRDYTLPARTISIEVMR